MAVKTCSTISPVQDHKQCLQDLTFTKQLCQIQMTAVTAAPQLHLGIIAYSSCLLSFVVITICKPVKGKQ
jgi:hypothetical protein